MPDDPKVLMKRAVGTRSREDYLAAARALLDDRLRAWCGEWSSPPIRAEIMEAAAGLVSIATRRNLNAIAGFIVNGWLPLPEDPHPTYMHPSIRDAIPAVVAQRNSSDLDPKAQGLHCLLAHFVLIEGSVRPTLGLLCGLGQAALGEVPLPERVFLETDGGSEGKIRSIGSMLSLFSDLLVRLKEKEETTGDARLLRALHVSLCKRRLGNRVLPGAVELRNMVAHLDFEIEESSIAFDFNRQTRAAAANIEFADLEESLNEYIRLYFVFRAVGLFAMAAPFGAPEGQS